MSQPTVRATRSSRTPRVLSTTVVVLGVLMVAVGIAAYAVTASELAAQKVEVAAVTADDPGSMAGDRMDDPFSALAQINAIRHHTDTATGGQTYAELENVATSDGLTYSSDVTVETSTDGQAHRAGDALSAADAATYTARGIAEQSSFLQASIYVSILAFGISALIAGLGLVVALIGLTIRLTLRGPPPQAA